MPMIDHLFVIGAGFSSYAGSPLTNEFTRALLDVRIMRREWTKSLIDFVRKFIASSFDHSVSASADYWPDLEDLFTCVDMSANSGHHLGPDFEPATLRTIRRALIVRIATMLRERYSEARKVKSAEWRQLEEVFKAIDVDSSAFISMNWDTVIEEGLRRAHGVSCVDY